VQYLSHTPWWVYVLLIFLISRGLRAMKPGQVTLQKLAIIPVLFTVWSLWDLVHIYGVTTQSVLVWVVGLLLGIAAGWLLVRRAAISVDPASGVIRHPADYTLLPLVLFTFAVKYTFGAISATSPDVLQQPTFLLADLGLSGLFSGIFVGKFAVYAGTYLSARKAPAL
jgi:hypothetical protein